MTRRRYKSPKAYRDGGRVPVDDVVMAEPAPEFETSADVTQSPTPEPAPIGPDPVQAALEATLRAHEMQSPPRPMTAEELRHQQIDSWPISDGRKAFLKKCPEVLEPANAAVVRDALARARVEGIPEDSEDENAAVLAAVWKSVHERHTAAIDNVRRTAQVYLPPQLPNAPPIVPQQQSAPFVPPPLAPIPPPAPTKRASSIPVSAPVSRDVPSVSTGRKTSDSKVTLSPEEREIARNSFGPVKQSNGEYRDMSATEKERLYAMNKLKLKAMRESGEYRRTTEQDG